MASSFTTCRACQRRVLDVFVSVANPSFKSTTRLSSRRKCITNTSQATTRRFLQTSSVWRQQDLEHNDKLTASQQPTQTISDLSTSSSTASPSQSTPEPTEHIPWYLQVEPSKPLSSFTATSTSLAAQELPPLPPDAPQILPSLLSHLSITIGLDHLTLLDLRSLQPPSALGANLLMIIGTARSEKHLNTSADRFCRWLRSTYKLRPFADGLLGRNELKLKLRRRNKKIRLAQSVGNTTMFATDGTDGKGYDDGITTGWICCNLGDVSAAAAVSLETPQDASATHESLQVVEDTGEEIVHPTMSQKDQERILEDEDDEYRNPSEDDFKYRGFGSETNAPRIVVQMFTEEKRLEMDLEGLWDARLKRRDEKAQKQDRAVLGTFSENEEVVGEELELPKKKRTSKV